MDTSFGIGFGVEFGCAQIPQRTRGPLVCWRRFLRKVPLLSALAGLVPEQNEQKCCTVPMTAVIVNVHGF